MEKGSVSQKNCIYFRGLHQRKGHGEAGMENGAKRQQKGQDLSPAPNIFSCKLLGAQTV